MPNPIRVGAAGLAAFVTTAGLTFGALRSVAWLAEPRIQRSPAPRPFGPPATGVTRPAGGGGTTVTAQIGELTANIDKWRAKRKKLADLSAGLNRDVDDLRGRLARLGVKTPGEASGSPSAEVLLGEVRDILGQLLVTDKKAGEYDLAILKSESQLRTIGRGLAGRAAGLGEADLRDLLRSVVALDDQLGRDRDAAVPAELDDTLAKFLAGDRRPK